MASQHLIILSLKSISRCVLAFRRVRSPPSVKYQVFGVDYCRDLPYRTYAIRAQSFGVRMDNSSVLYTAWLLYLHYVAPIPDRIRFVVSSDVPLNSACGRSAIGAERPILIPRSFYKKLKNVSCEYDRPNGWNSTLQAAWYIRHVRRTSDTFVGRVYSIFHL